LGTVIQSPRRTRPAFERLLRWKDAKVAPYLIPNTTKECEPLASRTLQRCRIFKILVNRHGPAGENRTAFLGIVADGENVVERLACELVYAFREMAGNVDAQLAHDRYRFRPNVTWLSSGAEYLETFPRVVAEKAFRHLAPG
jgi:hypothetical protein